MNFFLLVHEELDVDDEQQLLDVTFNELDVVSRNMCS
jgi:hypothetical protein